MAWCLLFIGEHFLYSLEPFVKFSVLWILEILESDATFDSKDLHDVIVVLDVDDSDLIITTEEISSFLL